MPLTVAPRALEQRSPDRITKRHCTAHRALGEAEVELLDLSFSPAPSCSVLLPLVPSFSLSLSSESWAAPALQSLATKGGSRVCLALGPLRPGQRQAQRVQAGFPGHERRGEGSWTK